MLQVPPPAPGDYAPYYSRYIEPILDADLSELFAKQPEELRSLLNNLPERYGEFKYEPGKWSIKDLLQHVIDTERIFSYRILRIGRGETVALPGFEHEPYVQAAGADRRSFESLGDEFYLLRACTLTLINSLQEEDFHRTGTASDNTVAVKAMPYIIAGHFEHHIRVLKERYLPRLQEMDR